MAKNLQFKGVKELQDVLDALPGKLAPKVLANVLRKAEKPLVRAAKAKAPKHDGDLQKSIGGIPGRGTGKGTARYVGPRRGGQFKGYAGHLVEYGTAPRTQKDGTSTGTMPANPFMRPAYDETGEQVVQIIKDECAAIVADEFRKVTKIK